MVLQHSGSLVLRKSDDDKGSGVENLTRGLLAVSNLAIVLVVFVDPGGEGVSWSSEW